MNGVTMNLLLSPFQPTDKSQGICPDFIGKGYMLLARIVVVICLTGIVATVAQAQGNPAAMDRSDQQQKKKAGVVYLAKNKTKKGVVTTKSGLQYKVLNVGQGKTPQRTDAVTIRYSGTLTDGNQFAATRTRTIRVTDPDDPIVIKAWTEALPLMNVGAKWKLFVSPDLAYGEFPIYSNVGPHAVLVFEIELLEIVK